MPSCLIVQHVEPEHSYAIGEALSVAGVEIVNCRTYAGEALPRRIGDFDGLVVMGGPMSATSDDGFASRRQEIALLAEAVEVGVPTLAVCLGAQLLALATGGRVIRSQVGPEIGWAAVRFSAAAAEDRLFAGVPSELPVLHWHADTYELPPEAVHLASSAAHHQQAFRVGGMAWGLQFHLEVDEVAVEAFLGAFGEEAFSAGTTTEDIRRATPGALTTLVPYRDEVLGGFATLVASHRGPLVEGRAEQLAEGT
jgi:GMP synthase-like glutamine amidotransferase